MTKRELKLLKSLLRSKGAYTKFKLNMKRARGTVSNLSTCSISCAFVWVDTPEGYVYWRRLEYELIDLRTVSNLSTCSIACASVWVDTPEASTTK